MTKAKYALEEVISFNEAVDRALTLTDDDDTLVVVTADHSHVMTIGGYPSRGNPILGQSAIQFRHIGLYTSQVTEGLVGRNLPPLSTSATPVICAMSKSGYLTH